MGAVLGLASRGRTSKSSLPYLPDSNISIRQDSWALERHTKYAEKRRKPIPLARHTRTQITNHKSQIKTTNNKQQTPNRACVPCNWVARSALGCAHTRSRVGSSILSSIYAESGWGACVLNVQPCGSYDLLSLGPRVWILLPLPRKSPEEPVLNEIGVSQSAIP